MNIKTYICHWEKLVDRKNDLMLVLENNNITNYEWITDYNKETWDKDHLSVEFPNVFEKSPNGRNLNSSEISLVLKHAKIVRNVVENNHECAMVFEDDVFLVDNFNQKLSMYMKQLPVDWDMFWIGSCCDLHEPYVDGVYVYPTSRGSRCTHAYMLSYSGAKKIYDEVKFANDGADWYYNYLISKFELKNYWAEPPLAYQNTKFKTSIHL